MPVDYMHLRNMLDVPVSHWNGQTVSNIPAVHNDAFYALRVCSYKLF